MCNDGKRQKQSILVLDNKEISPNIFKIVTRSMELARDSKPGQFVNFYSKDGSRILPRPISICETNKINNTLTFVYAVVGKGTEEFSRIKVGEYLDVLGNLGNGYSIDDDINEHIIVGGGLGIPPLLELAKTLKGKISVYLGYRSETFLLKEFEDLGIQVYIATDDGSKGLKGTVVDLLKQNKARGQMVYSCGPKPMLRALSSWVDQEGIQAQFSLEERMGCGIGACVGCVCKIKKEESFEYKKVCVDGPVFWSREVVWDD